ncbi:MAG TPA: dienelactone hydrolase family protein [Syntrophales bacterium]|nr:dienelactone hydrolase family protein [Syntrophales bacterium]
METGMDAPRAVEALAERLVAALEAFESAQRHYFPGAAPQLRAQFAPVADGLSKARKALEETPVRPGQEALRRALLDASAQCLDALATATQGEGLEASLAHFRKAGRRIHRVQEALLPLCPLSPAVNRYFLEPDLRDRAAEFLTEPGANPAAGLFHGGLEDDPYARGSVSFYIPESREGSEPMPLVVALHGGFGHGRDFLWTWLREARSRRFALACPTSRNITWSITGPDADAPLLQKTLAYAADRWNIDRGRVLLTGLSDGATYALKRALDAETPFSRFAPFSGILVPFDMKHAKGRRIYWVHGAKDWMFPAWRAKMGEKELRAAGADVTLEIVPDLYHAHPREKNGPVLAWFEPRLSLAPQGV